MKRLIIYVLVMTLLSFGVIYIAKDKSNSINSIEMDVYIDANGNAIITEIWDVHLGQGTEGYRPYTNLENSSITDFSVSDETGKQYEKLSAWNTDKSFDEKAYKSGINTISNGVELCWGISKYGDKKYTLKYTINNFVTKYTDKQGIYFNFLNLDQEVKKAKITIRSDKKFSTENAKIWAFGYDGTITFENGAIVLNSNGNLNTSQYMVSLIKFENNLFNTKKVSNKSFNDIYSSAVIGVKEIANYINNIEMDVYLNSNGDATITEIWDTNLNKGNEEHRIFINLENSKITNFSVSDEKGTKYQNISNWNRDSSFSEKAYKSGINTLPNRVELCWGISEYGNKKYNLKYTINNLVAKYTDNQGIYFNFLNLDQEAKNAKITIHSDKNFSEDNTKIWLLGYNGTVKFENGKIILNSNGNLTTSQYMKALIRFENNLFNTKNISSKSFYNVYTEAMGYNNKNESVNKEETKNNTSIDSNKTEENNKTNKNNSVNKDELGQNDSIDKESNKPEDDDSGTILGALLSNPLVLLAIAYFYLEKKKGHTWIWGSKKKNGSLNFGSFGKNLPSDKEINYWREIPCNKDLLRAYWVCYNYGIISTITLKKGIIGAILLKWTKEGSITVSKTRKGLFNLKDNNYAIDFRNMSEPNNEIEKKLFLMLKKASGFNQILEAKEFEKWCKRNYSEIPNWLIDLNSIEQTELEKQGLITSTTEETEGMFGSTRTIVVKNVNSQLREDAIQLKGLKKFLLDFSMMPEREYFEVHIWEEYLIFAQLMGIADKVEEQFSKLYPNFNEQTRLNTSITTVAVRNMVELGYTGYEKGKERAERMRSSSSSSYSSGGGGRSYSSGGSSSGGSSGGGFR